MKQSDQYQLAGTMSACVKQAKVETTTNGGGGGGNNSNKKNIVEIYTDWANHYLDKTKVIYWKCSQFILQSLGLSSFVFEVC